MARAFGIPIAWGVSAALLVLLAPAFLLMQQRLRGVVAPRGDKVITVSPTS